MTAMPTAIENGSWLAEAEDLNPGDLKQYIDFALPIVHGPYCEDGKLQGFLETMDIPYGGCGVLASAVAMDKQVARQVFLRAGLPMCKHVFLTKAEWQDEQETVLRAHRAADRLSEFRQAGESGFERRHQQGEGQDIADRSACTCAQLRQPRDRRGICRLQRAGDRYPRQRLSGGSRGR